MTATPEEMRDDPLAGFISAMMRSAFDSVFGVKIVETPNAVSRKQVRFPRSKKRRIRAKWEKRECNFTETPAAFQIDETGTIYLHPTIYARIKADFKAPAVTPAMVYMRHPAFSARKSKSSPATVDPMRAPKDIYFSDLKSTLVPTRRYPFSHVGKFCRHTHREP